MNRLRSTLQEQVVPAGDAYRQPPVQELIAAAKADAQERADKFAKLEKFLYDNPELRAALDLMRELGI